jgi:hypothetical protein
MKQISAKCNILAEIWFAVKIESRQLQNFGLIDTCGLDYLLVFHSIQKSFESRISG